MALDPVSEKIYYANYGSQVRLFDPATGADSFVGTTSGTIDGGLFYDALTGLVFVGTANAANPGLVELIDPATHITMPFASGFAGSTGILREPVTGDLYFLDGGAHPSSGSSALYRLEARFIPPVRIRLTPESATGPVGSLHSLQAAVEGDHPLEDVVVSFRVTTGPNVGTVGTAATDEIGHADFSYAGTGGPGVDQIQATFVASDGQTIASNIVTVEWTVEADVNLQVSALKGSGVAGAGHPYKATDTTRNAGSGAAPASATKFYLSTNATWDAADILLVPMVGRSVAALASGATSTGATQVTIPVGTPPGLRYLIAVADAGLLIAESNEEDNTRAKKIYVGPDLGVKKLQAPASASAGQVIAVTDTTSNAGGEPTAVAITTRFYLSVNKKLDGSDVALGPGRSVPVLGAKASSAGVTNVTIPGGTTRGLYYLLAKADGGDLVAESRETNNVKAVAVTVN